MVEIPINKLPLGYGVKVCFSTTVRSISHGSQGIEGFNIRAKERYNVRNTAYKHMKEVRASSNEF